MSAAEASPSKRDALAAAFDNERPFKNARVRALYEHDPPPPNRRFVDGRIQLAQNLTRNTIMSMLPDGVNIYKQRAPLEEGQEVEEETGCVGLGECVNWLID